MLMNLINIMYNMISDGKISDPSFWIDKGRWMFKEKNNIVIPRLAFPFCLKTVVK